MPNGQHEVAIAVLQEWRNHVDEDLDHIKKSLRATRHEQRDSIARLSDEMRKGLREVRDDVGTISRHVGRPLLSWPQTLTLVGSLLGTIGTLAVVVG